MHGGQSVRNAQLIRQWKILRALANGVLSVESHCEMAEIFDVDLKTIRRDLQGLAHAGFLKLEIRVRESKSPHKHKVIRLPDTMPNDVEALRSIMAEKVAYLDAGRCNTCQYAFKMRGSGLIDMRDFRRHKQLHL